ncbi:rhodanese-like domain-containing protein [Croceivirga radicis]|uniref:rhodanese-like domain-containing protein n=1 Tax=Croceivirga radicis TaxID=1929488 RepID=UPI000255B2EE|nr:rhodanese-like domain-containing protein [Croceivirga radicis]
MKKNYWIWLTVFVSFISACAQKTIPESLAALNKESVTYISVDELRSNPNSYIILDAREQKEFAVSHLPNAVFVGYKNFELKRIRGKLPEKKETPIVVYCSIGVRSENIGERLQKAGFTNVKNLYGGIFEWSNKGYPLIDKNNNTTKKVHAYSKQWGKLLTNGEKVYD